MKKILQSKINEIKTKADLLNNVKQIWDNFPQESIDRLVLSFAARLRHVINKGGESISDELRSSLTQIPSFPLLNRTEGVPLENILTFRDETVNDNPLEYQTLRQWTAEEDKILIEKTQIFGKQWSLLSKFFHCRTPLSIRKRYYYLYKH